MPLKPELAGSMSLPTRLTRDVKYLIHNINPKYMMWDMHAFEKNPYKWSTSLILHLLKILSTPMGGGFLGQYENKTMKHLQCWMLNVEPTRTCDNQDFLQAVEGSWKEDCGRDPKPLYTRFPVRDCLHQSVDTYRLVYLLDPLHVCDRILGCHPGVGFSAFNLINEGF